MQERRSTIRRKDDRQLRAEIQKLRDKAEGGADKKRQRRHAIRRACHAELDLEIALGQPGSDDWKVSRTRMKGRVLDLSETGASLFVPHALAIGQPFRLTIKLFDDTKIEAVAETRWTKTVEAKGGYAMGAQFRHIAPDHANAVRRFLAELEATAGL